MAARVLLYSQSLSGCGHFVRTFELACALTSDFDVFLIDGGLPIPRRPSAVNVVPLPRIHRHGGQIAGVEPGSTIEDVMGKREQLLQAAIDRVSPDVVVVEHFPFSKLELTSEVHCMLEYARRANRQCKVVCSLRDIAVRTRYEVDPEFHRSNTLETLANHFDLLVIHSDPELVRIDSHLPWAAQIGIPVRYSGYVSEKLPSSVSTSQRVDCIVVGVGGEQDTDLAERVSTAFANLQSSGSLGRHWELKIFGSLFGAASADTFLSKATRPQVSIHPFSQSFLSEMATARLAITSAGYNLCTNILETRTNAILAPHVQRSDQPIRSALLAERGLCAEVRADELGAARFEELIPAQLSRPPLQHDIDLEGGANTATILKELLVGELRVES